MQKFFNTGKKIFPIFYFLPLAIFFSPELFKDFGEYGWWILILIVFVRPISDIFPGIRVLKNIVGMRKELGILCGFLIIAHGLGFFLLNNYDLPSALFNPNFWVFDNFFGWGMIGFLCMLPALATSNMFSIKFLGKYWKWIQRLTYFFFIFGAVHIAMIKGEFGPYILILLFFIVHFLSFKKIKFNIGKNKI